MGEGSAYQMVVCADAGCRLRFPGVPGVACPLCKTATVLAVQRLPGRVPAFVGSARPLAVLVDNVRSVFNVGSMFRTADGCGATHLYLGGITATPEHPQMKKTSLGAEESVSWSHHRNAVELAQSLRAEGRVLWALEATERSEEIFVAAPNRPAELVLVIGNEVVGVDPGLLELCERIVAIPMMGAKVSLNVATAFGVAAYALTRDVDARS